MIALRHIALAATLGMVARPSPAAAQEDASAIRSMEIDADHGERLQADGEIQNEENLVSGCFQSSSDATLPPFWSSDRARVYDDSYAFKVVMERPAHYRNEQKPVQSWHRDDGARYFRFAFANGDRLENPTAHVILTQWWQPDTSPPVAIQFYGDRHPKLVTKDDFDRHTAQSFRYRVRWTDPETLTGGRWFNYLVKIKWGAGNGELKLWKWSRGEWRLQYDSLVDRGAAAPNYIGYHDLGRDQTNYTWKIGGYRAHDDVARYVMYFDEMRYANTWDRVLQGR